MFFLAVFGHKTVNHWTKFDSKKILKIIILNIRYRTFSNKRYEGRTTWSIWWVNCKNDQFEAHYRFEICHFLLNPYRQIPETISKKRAVTQGIFRKLFPGKFHEYLPMKTYFSQKRVMTQRLFRKLFPITGKSFRKFSWAISRIHEISNFI